MAGAKKQDVVGLLIRDAGARELIAAEQLERARTRVADHWRGVVAAEQQRHSTLRYFAVAASLIAVLGLAFLGWGPGTAPGRQGVATVNRVSGEVYVNGQAVSGGITIAEDDVLDTGDKGRVALELSTGQSLLMDNATRLVAQSGNYYALEQGGVYVASGAGSRTMPVFIATHFGVATDVGTQFQVRVSPDTLIIGVREGLVALARNMAPTVDIEVGRVYELSSLGHTQERDLEPHDEIWAWTESIAPSYDINGATLHDYLVWYARERGVGIEWRDRASRERSLQIRLSGSIERLSLEQGLQAVLRIAPFEYELVGKTLHVQVN